MRHTKQQSGFTMLELLITLVIFSFALLGIAGMQISAIKTNQSATYRSIAAQRALEIADRMRANMAGYDGGSYLALLDTTSAPADVICSSCTSAQLAQHDVHLWQTMNQQLLPGGAAVVCVTSAIDSGTPTAVDCDGAGRRVVIKVWWTDTRAESSFRKGEDTSAVTATPQRFAMVFQP